MDSSTRACCSMRLRDWMLSGNEAVIGRWNDDSLERSFIWTSFERFLFPFCLFSFLAVYLWFVYDWRWLWFDLIWHDDSLRRFAMLCYVHVDTVYMNIVVYLELLEYSPSFSTVTWVWVCRSVDPSMHCTLYIGLLRMHMQSDNLSCPMQQEAVNSALWYISEGLFSAQVQARAWAWARAHNTHSNCIIVGKW